MSDTNTHHTPTVTLQADVFPEDSFLLDPENEGLTTYTPEQVALEAWENQIAAWVRDGYRPILTVHMPDGSNHDVDLDRL